MSDFFFVNNTQKLTKESEIRKKKTYIIKIYNCYINFCLILGVKAFDLRLVLQPFIKSILYLFFFYAYFKKPPPCLFSDKLQLYYYAICYGEFLE